jgi:hypothetical protein
MKSVTEVCHPALHSPHISAQDGKAALLLVSDLEELPSVVERQFVALFPPATVHDYALSLRKSVHGILYAGREAYRVKRILLRRAAPCAVDSEKQNFPAP